MARMRWATRMATPSKVRPPWARSSWPLRVSLTERGQASPKACGSWPGRLVAGREVLKVAAQRAGPPGRQRRRVVRRRVVRRSGSRGAPRRRVAPSGCPGEACPAALSRSARARCSSASACSARACEGRRGRLRPPRSALRARPAARPGPARRPGGPGSPAGRRPGGPSSSSARAAWAASRAWAASCPAFLARVRPPPPAPRRPARPGRSVPARPRPPARRQPSPSAPRPAAHQLAAPQHAPLRPQPRPARGAAARTRTPGGPDPAARPHRDRAGPAAGAAGTPSAPYAAPGSPGPAARSTPAPPPACPRLRLILTARIRASEETLSGLDHRQAPFSADQHSVTGRARAAGTGAFGQPGHPRGGSHGCWAGWMDSCSGPGLRRPILHGQDAAAITPHPTGRVTTTPRSSQRTTGETWHRAGSLRPGAGQQLAAGWRRVRWRADTCGGPALPGARRGSGRVAASDSFTPARPRSRMVSHLCPHRIRSPVITRKSL